MRVRDGALLLPTNFAFRIKIQMRLARRRAGIARFDVAMQNPALMRVVHRARRRSQEFSSLS